ncbi:pyridoxamine 5'-phosphate oxidase family protein [Propionibacterium sp.]|uniref:pyridoxamine 5'-phosphate oxidase family protein n=1 Tax=Propionibacterium sp. TaxID=1977903 RepID=UPI0039E8F171
MEHQIHRQASRAHHDRAMLDALLDSQWFGVLSSVTDDGEPWAVPIGYARVADQIVVHGSVKAGLLRAVAAGAPVVFTVAAMDAFVVGHSMMSSSVNYRSATVRGNFVPVDGDEKARLLDAYTDFFLPGRSGEVRPHTAQEMAITSVLALAIEDGNWLYKARDGQASEPDGPSDAWGGVVGLRTVADAPERAPWSHGVQPASVDGLVERFR